MNERNNKQRDELLRTLFTKLITHIEKFKQVNDNLFMEALNRIVKEEREITDEYIDLIDESIELSVKFWSTIQSKHREHIEQAKSQ